MKGEGGSLAKKRISWWQVIEQNKYTLLRYFILSFVFGSLAAGYLNCSPVGFSSQPKLSSRSTSTTSAGTTSTTGTTGTTTSPVCNPPRVWVNGQCVCPGTIPDTAYCITAQCFWNPQRTQPTVVVSWCQNPYPETTPNSNSLEKGDSYPQDPGRFWEFVFMDPYPFSNYSYADSAVSFGWTYRYRAKYRAELPGREVELVLNSCTCP